MPLYLADSSIWIRRSQRGGATLAARFRERYARAEVATCVPVALEVLVGPVDGDGYDADFHAVWAPLTWLPLGETAVERALVVQRGLAHARQNGHRRRASAFLIAACAEAAGDHVVLWHADDDLSIICGYTGQAQEFVRPGSRARRAT